jgi:MSHA biogenesis protein MshJ
VSKFSYTEVDKSFNNMTLRERFILFAALLICTISITYFWLVEPAILTQTKIQKSLQKSYQAEKVLKNEIAEVNHRLKQDPLEEINNKIAFSQATLVQLDKKLDDKLVKFIHAQKMPIALTKVLSRSPGVKISALKSLPVKAFNTEKKASEKSEQDTFYQHTLEITLLGDYNAIYQYLLNVESLKEKFYWYSMDYNVSNYPLAEVTIQIYTLSDQQDLVSG